MLESRKIILHENMNFLYTANKEVNGYERI